MALALLVGTLGLTSATLGAVVGAGALGTPTLSFQPVSLGAWPGSADGAAATTGWGSRIIRIDSAWATSRPTGLGASGSEPGNEDAVSCVARAPAAIPTPASAPAPTSTPAGTTTIPRSVAAFIGDSYTTGWAGAGIGKLGWPSLVAGERGWRTVNRAVAGTGFVNPGWTDQPLRTQVAAVVRARPGIVFVAAGHNDRRFGPAATEAAAAAVLDRLRRDVPDAVIVVIGPIWQSGSPPQPIRGIRDRLRAQAQRIDAVFIDPLDDGWFAGSAGRLILADGIHPSNKGHQRIAALVAEALERDPRTTTRPATTVPAPASPDPTPAEPASQGMPACRR